MIGEIIEDYEDSLEEFGDGAATTAGWDENE